MMNAYNPQMYAFNAPIVPTHNNRRAADPHHLDCGRRLSFDDSGVVLPIDNHHPTTTATAVSSRRKNAFSTTKASLADVTSTTNNIQNNNNRCTTTQVKTPTAPVPYIPSTSKVPPVKEEEYLIQGTTTTPRADISMATTSSSTKYSLLFNPQGSRPLSAQLSFPGRYLGSGGGGGTTKSGSSTTTSSSAHHPPPPSSLQLSYSSGVRSQVLMFGRNNGSSTTSNAAPSIAYTTIMMEGSLAETNINSVALVGNCVAHKQQKKSLHLSKVAGASSGAVSVAPHSDMFVIQVGIPLSALTAPATFLSTGTHLSVDIVSMDLASSNLNNRRHIIVNLHEPTSSSTVASPSSATPRSATISKKKDLPIDTTNSTTTSMMGVASVNPQHCRISLPADIQQQQATSLGPQDVSSTITTPTTLKGVSHYYSRKAPFTPTTSNKKVEEDIQWFSLVIDAKSIIEKLYNTSFKGIESVSITGSNIQLRRVFCCCESRENQEEFTYYHLPRLMSFPVDIDSSIVINSSNIKVKSEKAAANTITGHPPSIPRRTTTSSPSSQTQQSLPPARITYGISTPRPENFSTLTIPLKASPSRPTPVVKAATTTSSSTHNNHPVAVGATFSNFSVTDTRKATVQPVSNNRHSAIVPYDVDVDGNHHGDDDPTLDRMSSIPTTPHQNQQQRQRTHEQEKEQQVKLSADREGESRVSDEDDDNHDLTPIRLDMADVASTVDCSFTIEYPSFNNHNHHHHHHHIPHHPSSSSKPSSHISSPLPRSPPPVVPVTTTTNSSSMDNFDRKQQKQLISTSPQERPSIRPTTVTTHHHHHSPRSSSLYNNKNLISAPTTSIENTRVSNVFIPVPSPLFVDTSSQHQSPFQANNSHYPPVENDRFSQCDGTVSMSSDDDSASEFEIERNDVQVDVSCVPSVQQMMTTIYNHQQEMSSIKQSANWTTRSSPHQVEQIVKESYLEHNKVEFERCSSSDSSKLSDVTVVLMAVGGRGVQNLHASVEAANPTRPSTVRILRPPTKVAKQHQLMMNRPATTTTAPPPPLVSQSLPSRVPKLQETADVGIEDRTFVSEPMSFLLQHEATPSSTHQTSSRQSNAVARTPSPVHQHWYDVQDWIAQTGSSSQDCSHPSPTSNDLAKDEGEVEFDPVIGCYFNTKSNTYEYPK